MGFALLPDIEIIVVVTWIEVLTLVEVLDLRDHLERLEIKALLLWGADHNKLRLWGWGGSVSLGLEHPLSLVQFLMRHEAFEIISHRLLPDDGNEMLALVRIRQYVKVHLIRLGSLLADDLGHSNALCLLYLVIEFAPSIDVHRLTS